MDTDQITLKLGGLVLSLTLKLETPTPALYLIGVPKTGLQDQSETDKDDL
jgi:hypothetical protein